MRIISYCDHCTECFKTMPSNYWIVYKAIVEHVVEKGHYMKILNHEEGDEKIHKFIVEMERRKLIVTHDNGSFFVTAKPNGLNAISFEYRPELQMIRICLDIEHHPAILWKNDSLQKSIGE